MVDYAKEFAANLKRLRMERGLTQPDFAAQIGEVSITVYDYEHAFRMPSFKKLMLIADYFGVTLDELVGRKCK